MRFMIIVKATKDSEAGILPTEKLLTDMGKYNEELAKAGIMLAGDGLQPSSKGARVPASMMPALANSSLYLPMSVSNFSVGRMPASESLVALTMTMKRMIVTPCN